MEDTLCVCGHYRSEHVAHDDERYCMASSLITRRGFDCACPQFKEA